VINKSIIPMTHRLRFVAIGCLLLLSGCMSLFHPQAEEWYQQAKGATGRQTALTLISMMDASAQQARTEIGESPGLNNLHDQFHALHKTFCEFSDQQAATTGYEQSLTLQKELQTVFHRLWKFKHDTSLRAIHLDLFHSRLQELRTAVQSIPS
jgi:hypothetical protein